MAAQQAPSAHKPTQREIVQALDPHVVESRTDAIFRAHMGEQHRQVDRWFLYLMFFQWFFAVAVAFLVSPYAWSGKQQTLHMHIPLAILGGGILSAAPIVMILRYPGAALTRHVIAVAQMLWSALLIHLTGGRIETHFHVFGSLAFLAFYRDYRILIPATVVVATDHLVRQLFWPESVYGITNPEWWRFLEHAWWVVFEDIFLVVACVAAASEEKLRAQQQAVIELTEHLQREMQIAARIQQSILPKDLLSDKLDISAAMIPATKVGGDYYDVLRVPGATWIGIGDVAGHGVTAGLVMMQTQSVLATLIRNTPNGSPSAILSAANRILYENIRIRMLQDEFITLSLVKHHPDGRVVMSGAHEEAIVVRGGTGNVERLEVVGTWLGAKQDVAAHLVDTTITLQDGDLLVLYTDGVTEARNQAREQFGINRLCDVVQAARTQSVDAIRDAVLKAIEDWAGTKRHDDDVTLLVLRQQDEMVLPSITPGRASRSLSA